LLQTDKIASRSSSLSLLVGVRSDAAALRWSTKRFSSANTFSPLTLSFTAPTGAAYLGQTLAIKMTSADVQTNFDNARLSAVPLPAALPLFSGGLALLGFAVRRRRVKV